MVSNPSIETTLPAANLNPELAELLKQCVQNDRLAQAQLYKQYQGKLLAMCMRYFTNRDDALEALNHGFLKVFKNLDKYNSSYAFEGWIYKIVQNTALDYFKSKYRKEVESSVELLETDVAVSALIDDTYAAEDLMQLLQALPPTTRAVFNLFAIEGYAHAEIAEMLQIAAGTSKWHVNKAREILKECITKNTHYHYGR
jgi:RNA polymerase sigma factor (sigma-70 family)